MKSGITLLRPILKWADWLDALEGYDHCIRINPLDASSFYEKAKINFILKRTKEAVECLKAAFVIDPGFKNEFEKEYPDIKSSKFLKSFWVVLLLNNYYYCCLLYLKVNSFIYCIDYLNFFMKNLTHVNTKLLGLIGHPIKQSYSPFIHNASFEIKKLDYLYFPFDITKSNLKSAIKGYDNSRR